MNDDLDPDAVERSLAEQSGDTIGRWAISPENVSYSELYDAAAFSWISIQDTPEGLLSPHNHRIVELIITP